MKFVIHNQKASLQAVFRPGIEASEHEANKQLAWSAPEMRYYLIERAEFLFKKETQIHEEIKAGNTDMVLAYIVTGAELERLLTILLAAGVEVVE